MIGGLVGLILVVMGTFLIAAAAVIATISRLAGKGRK
jgi:hypothetical protein